MYIKQRQDPAVLAAHSGNIGADSLRILSYLASITSPETGLAYITNRDITRLLASQDKAAAIKAYNRLIEDGHITQEPETEPAYRHPIYQSRAKTQQVVKTVRVTLKCNLLCSSTQHCPDPAYRALLETQGATEADLVAALELIYSDTPSFIAEELADYYKELLVESAPVSGGKNLIPGFYTQEELATGGGAHENLTHLAMRGLVTITRSEGKENEEGQLYKVLPNLKPTA